MTRPEDAALKGLLDTLVRDEGLRPLARRTGIPLGVIRAIVEGRDTSGRNLQLAADKLGLEFYIGPPRAQAEQLQLGGAPIGIDGEGGTALVDRLDLQVSAGAGSLGMGAPAAPVPFSAVWLRRHNLKAGDLSFLEVRGDSMEPILFDGDPILVDKRKSRPKSGGMYVVVRPESIQVKWVMVLRNAVQLVSENEAYPPERVDQHDAPDFYRVRWFGHFIS